jgi:hypothetical protein
MYDDSNRCTKCKAELQPARAKYNMEAHKFYYPASERKGICHKCGWRNEWFAKRGFSPTESSKHDGQTKRKRHKHKRLRRSAKKGLDRIIKAIMMAAKASN